VLFYCLATAIVGVWLIRREATALADLARNTREAMIAGRRPAPVSIGPHALWALIGVLLVVPGVLSDGMALGLVFLAFKQRGARSAPAPRRRPDGPTPPVHDVEIIPPGRIASPFKRPPDIIDIN
jgi:UPF0716 family protein affecting phage T7 exclusion